MLAIHPDKQYNLASASRVWRVLYTATHLPCLSVRPLKGLYETIVSHVWVAGQLYRLVVPDAKDRLTYGLGHQSFMQCILLGQLKHVLPKATLRHILALSRWCSVRNIKHPPQMLLSFGGLSRAVWCPFLSAIHNTWVKQQDSRRCLLGGGLSENKKPSARPRRNLSRRAA